MLGLAAIVVLQNGLRLAALPPEFTGILTGALLLITLAAGQLLVRRRSMLALAAALIIAASGGAWFVAGRSMQGPRITPGMVPKAKAHPSFWSVLDGAPEAAPALKTHPILPAP